MKSLRAKTITAERYTVRFVTPMILGAVMIKVAAASSFDVATDSTRHHDSFSRLAQNASPAFQAFDNYDLTGPDISVKSSIDLQACFAACQFERACQALSFDKWKKQCFLKKSAGSARFDPSLISELPVSAPLPSMAEGTITVEALPGTGFSGDAYRSATSSSLGNCELVCQNDKDCVAFTYLASQQTCKEFQTVAGYIPDHVSDSGVKRQVRITVAEPPLAPAVTPQLETRLPTNPLSPPVITKRVKRDVSLGYLNLRSGPGQNFDILTRVPAGASGVILSGQCVSPDDGKSAFPFCLVEWSGHRGWVSSNGLE